ncbi:hypothetical protein J6590_034654, partial [Homalodisca vitripennis]
QPLVNGEQNVLLVETIRHAVPTLPASVNHLASQCKPHYLDVLPGAVFERPNSNNQCRRPPRKNPHDIPFFPIYRRNDATIIVLHGRNSLLKAGADIQGIVGKQMSPVRRTD